MKFVSLIIYVNESKHIALVKRNHVILLHCTTSYTHDILIILILTALTTCCDMKKGKRVKRSEDKSTQLKVLSMLCGT